MTRIITNGPKCPRAEAAARQQVSRPCVIGGGEAKEGTPEVLGRKCRLAGEVQRGEVFAWGLQPSFFSSGLMAVRYIRATWPVAEHVQLV